MARRSLLALVLALVGCSSDPAASTCKDYVSPASFDAQQPTVSFAKDVFPILAQNCAFASCHGSTGASNGIFLGEGDAAGVHHAIVGVAANELPSMPYVTAGDPRASYLMRKLDASQCAFDAHCSGKSCGEAMPKNAPQLSLTDRDTIRRWIAQGAKND